MSNFFHLVLTQPLLNALIWLYNVIPSKDLGLAIVALTLLIRLLLIPLFQQTLRAQKEMAALQPKLEELKAKHQHDKQAQTRAMMEFYRQNKVNPFSSCLPILIQLPILIALYRVFLTGLNGAVASDLYPFVANPGVINTNFLGFLELSKPNFFLAALAGVSQFWQSKIMPKPQTGGQDQTAKLMQAQLLYFMPILTVVIAATLPAALGLYWLVTTIFAIAQQYYIMRRV